MKRLRSDAGRTLQLAWLACLLAVPLPLPVSAAQFYVDSRLGADSNEGTSPQAAWNSLLNLGTHAFQPGDSILFARGSRFTGGFVLRSSGSALSPIVLTSYGAGDAPAFTNPDWAVLNGNIIRVQGSHIVISNLFFHDNTNPPTQENSHHDVQKMGVVYLGTRADSNEVRDCEFVRSPVGIKIKGSYNLVTRNYLHDASEQMQRTWGAIAIMVVAPHNEISYNRIERYGFYGGAYGSDGGAIELDGVDDAFDGRDINVHHNISIANHGFFELAGRDVDSITVAYNLSDDVDKFVGGGAMKHTRIDHNTVIRTREPNIDRWVFWTFYPEGTEVEVTNNIFVVPKDILVFPQTPKPEGHHRTGIGRPVRSNNLYWSPSGIADPLGVPPGPGDVIADPMFVAPEKGDYRVAPDSPARRGGITRGYFPP